MRYLIMIATCLVVVGAMAIILAWFLRQLRKIEAHRWGKVPVTTKAINDKKTKQQEKSK
ncbi:MAG: hypothetical protein PHI84_04820 [Kiritimatiellae bacterium]|nr:hypothetical protein [Kiritimatiellia bacterium]